MELVIGTFNIQNKYKEKRYDGCDALGDHTKELIDFMYRNNIDILGIQELVKRYRNRLRKNLDIGYSVVGKYRFTRVGNYLPFFSKYNEKVDVITKHKVLNTKTKYLPFLLNIPRIVTISQLLVQTEKIIVINTHLDYTSKTIQKMQLKRLIRIIKQYDGHLVLMGDFNLTMKDDIFKDFLDSLKKIGIQHVLPKERTHHKTKDAIDHLFLSNSMRITSGPTVDKSIPNASDHYPVIIRVEI